MNQIVPAASRTPEVVKSTPIADTIDNLKRESFRELAPQCNPRQKIHGRILGIQDLQQVSVAGAQVELQIVASLKTLATSLPDSVLSNFRKLFLERLRPVDLYASAATSIVDVPATQFADIAQLPNVPGFELLAAAAKSLSNTSFRQLLGNNPAIFQPLLCYYHPTSMPAVYSMTTVSDTAGFFNFSVMQLDDEQTGYRFVVRRSISPNLYVSLYNPSPAGWYTHWGLRNEDGITLRSRHPLAFNKNP